MSRSLQSIAAKDAKTRTPRKPRPGSTPPKRASPTPPHHKTRPTIKRGAAKRNRPESGGALLSGGASPNGQGTAQVRGAEGHDAEFIDVPGEPLGDERPPDQIEGRAPARVSGTTIGATGEEAVDVELGSADSLDRAAPGATRTKAD